MCCFLLLHLRPLLLPPAPYRRLPACCRHWHGRGGPGRNHCTGGAGSAPPPPRPALLKHPAHWWGGAGRMRRSHPPVAGPPTYPPPPPPPCTHSCSVTVAAAAGGTARCPGLVERLRAELRPLVPDDYEVGGGWCWGWCGGGNAVAWQWVVLVLALVVPGLPTLLAHLFLNLLPPRSHSHFAAPCCSWASTWPTTRCCAPGRAAPCWRLPRSIRSWR